MGRRNSSCSIAGSFRLLDDAFLQKQTRIWLGEVLSTRLDELLDISDLLADGELLCKVSEVLWNFLLTKYGELWHLKANLKGPTASRKSGGRYMPYSNVDSFLKICKIFGLNGIDLFSPSDVVEKKNTRKVCICIRALSKKARSKQLHLPDFDIVTYTAAMPKYMVECLRKSLESPQSTFASSSTYSSYEYSRSKLKQVKKLLISGDVENNYVSSEMSDEAESNYGGVDCHFSSLDKLEAADMLNSDLENSPGAYSSTKTLQDESRKVTFISLKPSVNHSKHDDVEGNMSFFHEHSRRSLNDRVTLESHAQINSARVVDLSLRNEYLAPNELHYSTQERDYISEYLAFSDSVVLGTDCGSPILFDGEESTYNFFMGIDACGSNLKGRDFETGSQRRDSDVEDEVSSTTSMSSIFGRVLAMEFDDRFDLDGISPTKDYSERLQDKKVDQSPAKGKTGSCETEGVDECGTITGFSSDAEGHIVEMEGDNLNHDALTSTVEPEYIQRKKDSHGGQEKGFHSNDIENGDERNSSSILREGTSSIGSNTIASEFNYSQHTNTQDFSNTHNDLSSTKLENFLTYRKDEVSHEIKIADEQGDQKTSSINVSDDNFDIYPAACVSPQEVYQSSFAKLFETVSIGDHQTCSGVETGTNFAEFTNQDCQQSVEEVVSECKGDSDNERSHNKPHRKLINRVATGTAIVGVLFFLFNLSKRVGDENGKVGKKIFQTKKYTVSKSTKQEGNQGSKVTRTYPAEKFKI